MPPPTSGSTASPADRGEISAGQGGKRRGEAKRRAWGVPYLGFALPAVLAVGLLYLVPLGWLAVVSFGGPSELTLKWYVQIFGSEGIRNMLWTTVRIVGITTAVSLVLGYLIAYAMAHMGERQRLLLTLCVLVPFWLSVLVRALAWLILLRNNGIINSGLLAVGAIDEPLALVRNELGVVIGMVHYMIPYAVFPLYGAMRNMDQRLLMAARSSGAGPARTFRDVFLPLTLPAIFGAGLLVFVFGLGFFVTPAILGGGRIVMLSEYVSINILQTPRWGLASALSILLLLATLALIWAMSRIVNLRRMLGAG
jgi:putative spermidine/putrescine transport system permease protein